jgi:HK97 family phage portal protein
MFEFFKRKKTQNDDTAIEHGASVGAAVRNNPKPTFLDSSGKAYTLTNTQAPSATQAMSTSELIFTCADFIATASSQARFNVMVKDNKNNKKIPYNNKAVVKAFKVAPSPTSTWAELLNVASTQILLEGESFITMELVNKQFEFTVIDSDTNVEILFDTDHPEIPTGYMIGDTTYNLDEMLHIKRAGIARSLHGVSILPALVDPLVVDGYASNDLISLYENGSVGELYLSSDTPLAPSQVEEIERKLANKYTKAGRHKTFILPNGLSPQALKITPKDAVILDAMTISEDRILRAFKLHRTALGGSIESYTHDMLSLNTIQFNNAVRPILNLIKDKMEATLRIKLKKDDIVIDIDYSNLPEIARSLTVHTEVARALYSSGLASLNEARELVGLSILNDPLANENFLPEFLHGSSMMSIQGLDEAQLKVIRDAKVAEAQAIIMGAEAKEKVEGEEGEKDTEVTTPSGSDAPEGGTPNGNGDGTGSKSKGTK